jgi:2-keto-3-deoxy-L-rhamnonate aldolase RhmA
VAVIETATGVANADEIAAVKGIDAIFPGPAGFAFSMGLTPQERSRSRAHADAIARIQAACRSAGIAYDATGPVDELRAQ